VKESRQTSTLHDTAYEGLDEPYGPCCDCGTAAVLIHTADDLASFLRYPLVQFLRRGARRDAADQAHGSGTDATRMYIQDKHRSTTP